MDRVRRWTMAATAALIGVWIAASSVLAADSAVTIADLAFDPATVTIQVGDSVTWTNEDSTAHTATSASFDTGTLGSGESGTVTFDTAGSFPYLCSIHPAMTGTVVVEAAAGTAAPTPEPASGGGAAVTPAPTDTVAVAEAEDRGMLAVTGLLAGLGLLMLLGTLIADRRFRARDTE